MTITTEPARLATPSVARARAGLAAWLEPAYGVVLVAMLTQGPVLSMWWRQQTTSPGQPSADVAILVTYYAVQLPALALLARRGLAGAARWVLAGLFALCTLMLLSTAWSSARLVTGPAAVSLVITTLAGLYFGTSFSPVRQVVIVLLGVQPGLIASQWAVSRRWEGAVDTGHNWVGIYYNRNSLSPPAVVGAAAALVLIVLILARRPAQWPAMLVGLVAVLWWCLRFQRSARSATSLMALAAFAVTFFGWTAMASLLRRRRLRAPSVGGKLGVAHLSLLTVGTLAVLTLNRPVSRLLGRPPGFDGRTGYWATDWAGVRDHPVRGWGWLAAWATPAFRVRLPLELAQESWSHSSYLDLLLGAGVAAVLAFGVATSVGFWHAGKLAMDGGRAASAWPIASATLVLVAATQESFIIGNHFLWLLCVAALTTAARPGGSTPVEPRARVNPLRSHER